jgi:hypothetical protein
MGVGTHDKSASVWRAPWEFAVHAFVGVSIFGVIAAAAVLLGFGVQRLENVGIGIIIVFGLKGAEYALFLSDLTLFIIFLWRTSIRTIQTL